MTPSGFDRFRPALQRLALHRLVPIEGAHVRRAAGHTRQAVDECFRAEIDGEPAAAAQSLDVESEPGARCRDYALGELPEAATLAEWGGRAVIVPYVTGRSTTRLIQEVLTRAR